MIISLTTPNTYFLTEEHTEFQWIHGVSKCHPAFIAELN